MGVNSPKRQAGNSSAALAGQERGHTVDYTAEGTLLAEEAAALAALAEAAREDEALAAALAETDTLDVDAE